MSRKLRRLTEEKLEQLRNHPYFAQWRENVLKKAEEYLNTEPPRIKYSKMHSYYVTGRRSDYADQGIYHDRLSTFFAAYMLTEEEKYLVPLADDLWNICDFECWTGPWHIRESASLEDRFTELELGSTAHGANIAEVLAYVGDKLPELVYRRAKDQVFRRIINSYADKTNEQIYWFYRNTNWSAVCTYQVFAAYFFLASDEQIRAQIPRMLQSVECYLSGLDEEGCCIEGYHYWNYGFGAFCRFADMLREFTEGEIDLFKNEKVHDIALFQQRMAMNETECLSFSDCPRIYRPDPALSHLLKQTYDDVEIPPMKASTNSSISMRDLSYLKPEFENCSFKPKSHSFKNAQWFVYHSDKYSLGAKAGHNKEIHNQNDVGAFMFSKDNKISFCDLGAGEYTADYFNDNRYTVMVCSSRGHSVPIVNGKYQIETEDKSEVCSNSDNCFKYRMGKVYDDPTLKSIERGFECLEDRVILTDTFEFDSTPESLVERFVSDLEIIVEEGRFICHHTILEFDPNIFEASVSSEPFVNFNDKQCRAYFADLKVKNPEAHMELKFVIK